MYEILVLIYSELTHNSHNYLIERCFASGGMGWRTESGKCCGVLLKLWCINISFTGVGLLLSSKSLHGLNVDLAGFPSKQGHVICLHACPHVCSPIITPEMFISSIALWQRNRPQRQSIAHRLCKNRRRQGDKIHLPGLLLTGMLHWGLILY